MYRISGPIASYALKIGDKNIILFGDWHESKDRQCTPCEKDCMYMVDLLSKVKTNSNIFVESFIYSNPAYFKRIQPKDVLTDVIKTNFDKMHKHKGKFIDDIKVHYSDLRSLVNYEPFDNAMWYMMSRLQNEPAKEMHNPIPMISWCDTLQKLKLFIDAMLQSDDYIESVKSLIDKDNVNHFTHRFELTRVNRKYITRLRKQVLTLKPEYQDILFAFHNDTCAKLLKKHKRYDKAMSSFLQKGTFTKLDMYAISYALLKWGSHVKDLYTIARMLFYLDRTNNIISYDGSAHSKTYASFFKTYMHAKLIHKVRNYTAINWLDFKVIWAKGKGFRCVKLPKKVVREVFNIQ